MKLRYLSVTFLVSQIAFAQDYISTEHEKLVSIPIGLRPNQANYHSDEEGLESIGAPFVDREGILNFYSSINGKIILRVVDGQITPMPYGGGLQWYRERRGRNYSSQQGMLLDTSPLAFTNGVFLDYAYEKKKLVLNGAGYFTYPAPFGAILYSDKEKAGIAVVFDVRNPRADFEVVDQRNLPSWLPTQPGGFSIGTDGLLYRNRNLWSATPPKGKEQYQWSFIGRLISGHTLWGRGPKVYASHFVVCSADGTPEVEFDSGYSYPFNYGIGPWGELYFLIPPPAKGNGRAESDHGGGTIYFYEPDERFPAELVVLRSHLRYFGRLKDGGARLRLQATTQSEILGTYPIKTGFRVLETGTVEMTIDGQKGVWYKVRLLDGKEGWFFGSFVQVLYDGPKEKSPPWPNVPDW